MTLRRLLLALLAGLLCLPVPAQIVNRLRVDQETFLRYAYGRMQQFNPDNLALADSIYAAGVHKDDYRYKCLALSLEMPVRFAQHNYSRMDETAAELKDLLIERKEARDFYFTSLHEYCEYLVRLGRASEAMLEARGMGRLAGSEKRPSGRMYSYRIIGLIHSSRENHHLAIRNLEEAVQYCKSARAEQDLPNLYILIAQEYIKLRNFPKADQYVSLADQYERFFPSIRIRSMMTRASIAYARGDIDGFRQIYYDLLADPLYRMQADADSRYGLDIDYLRSRGQLEQALALSDSLGTLRSRLEHKHGIYADMQDYDHAYGQLSLLMQDKDSVYIKVQNEDLAILDAEMHNAQLREEAQKLKARNQLTVMIGFLVMFAIAFFAILLSQWQLRHNLDEMRRKNNQMLATRRAFQKAMDAKESENAFKIQILQNRKTNMLRL
ncbi:MAG: hypothetical protein IJM05_06935 [Bacteroidales bacterium]|nr:hypothetical protein [Bacteroidales bacterium]